MVSNLKKLRKEFNVSQKTLADAIGVSQQSINKYENHSIEPDIETLKLMADYFSTTIDYLVGYREIEDKLKNTRELLGLFHLMTAEQQQIFIEQGRVFVKANEKNKKGGK